MAGGTITLQQFRYRIREDTVDPTTDTWAGAINQRWTPELDTNFRVRFGLRRTPESNNNTKYYDVYYSVNGGTKTFADNATGAFTPNSVVRAVNSNVAGYVAGDDATQMITNGYIFISNNNGIVESDGFTPDMEWTLDASNYTAAEFEFCFQIRSEYVSPGDSISLYVFVSDAELTLAIADVGHWTEKYPKEAVPVFVVNKDRTLSVSSGGTINIGSGGTLAITP